LNSEVLEVDRPPFSTCAAKGKRSEGP
jgi:hypothetical protein